MMKRMNQALTLTICLLDWQTFIVILKAFSVLTIQFLTVRKHLLQLGKALNIKCRSLGKYQLLIPLAKALVTGGHVCIQGAEINYRNLKRNQVKVVTDINSLISSTENSSDSETEIYSQV